MTKPVHYIILGIIVVACAALSAYTVHRILIGSVINTSTSTKTGEQRSTKSGATPTIAIFFPKSAEGVYILPTANPTNPLELGANTVGGATACERLNNLKICLQKKNSSLISRLKSPEATSGAGLNEVCGSILNELADLRPQTVEIGCIW